MNSQNQTHSLDNYDLKSFLVNIIYLFIFICLKERDLQKPNCVSVYLFDCSSLNCPGSQNVQWPEVSYLWSSTLLLAMDSSLKKQILLEMQSFHWSLCPTLPGTGQPNYAQFPGVSAKRNLLAALMCEQCSLHVLAFIFSASDFSLKEACAQRARVVSSALRLYC